MNREIIYIQSHPIQYFAPFFAEITNAGLSLQVLYCSDESLRESLDVQFGKAIQWDIPLLSGYKSEFIFNNATKPSIHAGFFGLVNWGIVKKLKNAPKSLVIVPGWNYASYWIGIFSAKWYGHDLAIRGESPLNQEVQKKGGKKFIRKVLLKYFLFRLINHAFYIGTQNFEFYRYYGVSEKKLGFVPYSVDNQRFQKAGNEWLGKVKELKASLGLDSTKQQILYSGKFISKKRPLDLLHAFNLIDNSNTQLVMVGDGELRPEMEEYIKRNGLGSKVFLTGFVNQTDIVKYYAASDIFVMCSGVGETWGLSVNEAMNFGLKLVVSKTTGCSIDLAIPESTGWVFETGNVKQLSKTLESAIFDNKIKAASIINLVDKYSYKTGIETIKQISEVSV
jgi:glycosyltransferase involved in cell wall biosynthesis